MPSIRKIEVASHGKIINAPVTEPKGKTPLQEVVVKAAPTPTIKKSTKPVSISISRLLNGQGNESSMDELAPHEQIRAIDQRNESYSSDAFEQAWIAFSRSIPEQASVVSYINNNLPKKIAEHTYEIIFSNVLQENEFKKLLTALSASVRETLKNSAINFITKVVDNTTKDIKRHPEDIFKRMAEQNPALMTLKKNLNLEID